MKSKTIIYIVIGVVVLYLIYKAYMNYQSSGSIFKSASDNGCAVGMIGCGPLSGPPTTIYKTKQDYYDKVPIILNDAKTEIIAYPAPTDVCSNGQCAYPTKLNDGYLLGNRGIGKNSVFLNLTYEEFGKLAQAPSLSEMMNMITDKNPFTEMYNAGNRYQYKDVVVELNAIIDSKQLSKFKRII